MKKRNGAASQRFNPFKGFSIFASVCTHTIHAIHSNTHISGKFIFPCKLKTIVRFKLFRIHSVHHCGQKENKTKQNGPKTLLSDATATAVNVLLPVEKRPNENNSPGFFASTFYYWCCSSLLCLVFPVPKWPIAFVFHRKCAGVKSLPL